MMIMYILGMVSGFFMAGAILHDTIVAANKVKEEEERKKKLK